MAVWFVFVNTALCSYAHKTLYREVCGHVFLKREFVSIEKALIQSDFTWLIQLDLKEPMEIG